MNCLTPTEKSATRLALQHPNTTAEAFRSSWAGRLRKSLMKDLVLTLLWLFFVGTIADILAHMVLRAEGNEPPTWTRWVPFADLYFWWMK